MNNDINEKIVHAAPVPPFVRFVASAVPMVFDNSLSYYEALCALWKWLQDDVINVINNNATVTEHYIELDEETRQLFIELKSYVDNYFDNLDVQEEINNKLDQMAEDGTLEEIIGSYLSTSAIWAFDTVADMLASTNLIDGSYARTYGKNTYNDGFGKFYKIRTLQAGETPDGVNLISFGHDDLVAELYTNIKYPENVILKKYFINEAPVYCTELYNVEEIKVEPTANILQNYSDSTNLNDYNRESSKYEVFVNAGVFNTTTLQPLGWTLTDTEQIELSQPQSYNAITAIKDGMIENIAFGTYNSINDMKTAGYKNCVTAYDTLILNNDARTPDAPYRDNVNLVGQRSNGDIVLIDTTGRLANNTELNWATIANFILEKYPDMEIVTILDGGGSLQVYNRDSELVPVGSSTTGRIVPTMLCFKIKETI